MLLRVVAVLVALGALGCAHRVSRPPVLEPAPVDGRRRVDVYFDEQPFELQLLRPRQPKEPHEAVLASCARDCRLSVLPGHYRLRTRGDAPVVDYVATFEQSSQVDVTKGSHPGRITGMAMVISGGVATAGLPLGLYTRQFMSERDKTPAVLAIVGASGLVTFVVGLLVQSASRTRVQVTPLAGTSTGMAPARGGFSF